MHRFVLFAIAISSLGFAAEPPQKDRQAILAMAGTHAVKFRFEETAAIAPGYQLKPKPYEEHATEVVTVVEDQPERIALQHLLVVKGKDGGMKVIKHWAQIWTWQDTELLDYRGANGHHVWKKVRLAPEQAAGTWSQLVTQIDDTPRYEGYGKWNHENGESSWESNPTRRPLPRREYTTRNDYDYLLVTNRHTLSNDGWIHFQDNRKVVDREGEEKRILCYEAGLNSYYRVENADAAIALAWWKENGGFWDAVRDFWTESGESAASTFAYRKRDGGESLSERLKRLEKEKPSAGDVAAALRPYLVVE